MRTSYKTNFLFVGWVLGWKFEDGMTGCFPGLRSVGHVETSVEAPPGHCSEAIGERSR
jgi:hypothetical protein